MAYRVLILCTGNSCRSQMAEALIRDRYGETWQAFSAGTHPATQVNPNSLKVLSEAGISTAGLVPQNLKEYIGQAFDMVITVCDSAAELCPTWPGQGERIHISFPDPAAATGTPEEILQVYRNTRDNIEKRLLPALEEFVQEQAK